MLLEACSVVYILSIPWPWSVLPNLLSNLDYQVVSLNPLKQSIGDSHMDFWVNDNESSGCITICQFEDAYSLKKKAFGISLIPTLVSRWLTLQNCNEHLTFRLVIDIVCKGIQCPCDPDYIPIWILSPTRINSSLSARDLHDLWGHRCKGQHQEWRIMECRFQGWIIVVTFLSSLG